MLTTDTQKVILFPEIQDIDPAAETQVMQSIVDEDTLGGPKKYYTINEVRQNLGAKFGLNL
ncbi:hypothetical protein IJI55_02695 [Candidatus Saccharibacteria bacterium]|nr:hypothetical protein [Candidatus Saccharibacteria bacterium]MBR3323524.1 hypothetical protein [Candidatus Saccharibacteria bacterium]